MDKKNLLYIGIGVVVGYFLISYFKRTKENSELTGSTVSSADQAKIDACNKAVEDYMATAKFGAGADLEAIKKAQFDACMAN